MSDAATPAEDEQPQAGGLAALVAARLCHDLISPLGAIGNGVELMQLTAAPGTEPPPELTLIGESVSAARARISCFRIAFGPASGEQRLSKSELESLLRDMAAGGRLRIDLDSQGDQTRAEVKLLLLALNCLETALPWGGRVLVCRAVPGWRLVAEATRTKPDPALWAWIGGEPCLRRQNTTPAEVHFPVFAAEAAAQGRQPRWEVDETGAEIAF
ncbi:histidine phosphotransferase [Paracoccus suum]|uniref:Histidine phosphotransferase n=1 Tax=Paracoccus suum TaxID=2259340 RepID=A0A344PM45_9RHOB|nr:histidine phosphotransferase family protein [Paracoccus suum]AXC50450.1 histidine phosphotransferase [Paracoccus suum]